LLYNLHVCVWIPFSSKKKFDSWISLWIPRYMSACTSEEQVTLHEDNCTRCPLFHKWKIKWTFFEVTRDFTSYLYSFLVWPAGDTLHVKSLENSEYFVCVFTYEITCKWHIPREITCELQNISNEFLLMKM